MTVRLLAVDGGGSKTAFSLCDENGVELLHLVTEGSNWHAIGQAAFRNVMTEAAKALQPHCSETIIDTAVFALAGTDTPEDEVAIRNILQDIFTDQGLVVKNLLIENDAYATLKGMAQDEPAVLLISGTGAIAFAQDANGRIIRTNGWGHRTGDAGGGRWMGMRTIDAIFRMEDGRGPATSLKEKVLKTLELQTVDQLCNWVNGPEFSGELAARLTTQLAEAASEGDMTAKRIVGEAAEELAHTVITAMQRLDLQDSSCSIYCNGGNLRHFTLLFEEVSERIANHCPLASVIRTTVTPIEIIAKRARYYHSL